MTRLIVLAACACAAAACGGGGGKTDAGPTQDGAIADAGAPPSIPALGTQIDRMGRPAINTALDHAFDPNMAMKDAAKDAYNVAADPAMWTQFVSEIRANLAILDGLDANCGNQIAADQTAGMRYAFLAGVLADDRLFVNTASGTCATYLGVEANALGLANTDCGGRQPLEDVIDVTYSLLAAGAPSGVTDGVAADTTNPPNAMTFPFLGAPN